MPAEKSNNRFPVIAAITTIGLICALLIYGVVNKRGSSSIDTAVANGEQPMAPDQNLPILGSKGTDSLKNHRGEIVLLNFWASWCEPCKDEAPALEAVHRTLQKHNGTVLGVTFRDTTPDSLAFTRRYGITYPNLRDVDGQLAKQYSTHALPETFLINRAGKIVKIWRGQITQKQLETVTNKLIANE